MNNINKLINIIEVHPSSVKLKNLKTIIPIDKMDKENIPNKEEKKMLTAIISANNERETNPCNKCLLNLSFVSP